MDLTLPAVFPVFPDVEAGIACLARLPLANPAAAERQMVEFLDRLLAAPPEQPDFLALLERVRIPLAFVEEERARHCQDKPLPLGESEERVFRQVTGAWRKLADAYALAFHREARNPQDPTWSRRVATLLHRRLGCVGMIVFEHYRARRELPPGLWLEIHGCYRLAEDLDVAGVPVMADIEDEGQPPHCAAAYVACLLLDMAGPYGRSLRDIVLLRRWAARWASSVSVEQLEAGVPVPPRLVDLMADAGLQPSARCPASGRTVRRLDTAPLSARIREAFLPLQQMTPPTELGLGEGKAGQMIPLLEQLSLSWSQSAVPRKFRRFAAAGTARVCTGFEAMHFHVAGRAFRAPGPGRQQDFPAEEWEVIDHSASGFRLARSAVGERLAHGQLLALCPHDGERFLLAHVCWLTQDQSVGLVAGVAVLPGLPSGVAVQADDAFDSRGQPVLRAFLLAPVPTVTPESSIVLPLGLYRAGRLLEVQGDRRRRIRLKDIQQQGMDFERASFETV